MGSYQTNKGNQKSLYLSNVPLLTDDRDRKNKDQYEG